MAATKTPGKKWRVAETGTALDDATAYTNEPKANEAANALMNAGKPVTIWHFEGGRWWTFEKLHANGMPA